MADKIYDVGRFRHSIDNWQLSMLLGIIFFIVGIVVFFEPGGTYLALSVLFGIVVILSGAFELYLGTKAPTGSGKGWYIAGGVVEILLGILLLAPRRCSSRSCRSCSAFGSSSGDSWPSASPAR